MHGIKNTAGNATKVNLNVTSNNGGTPFNPNLITVKFAPQTITTNIASIKSFRFISIFLHYAGI